MKCRSCCSRLFVSLCVIICFDGNAFIPQRQDRFAPSVLMTTNLKDDVARLDQSMSSNGTPTSPTIVDQNENNARTLQVSFSHIQLYTDRIGSIEEYKQLEDSLNEFDKCASLTEISEQRKAWKLLESGSLTEQDFVSQNRDVVKQLLVGFGFRVTGHRFPNKREMTNTRSLLVTSRDPNGVQIVVTAIDASEDQPADSYFHFDAENIRRFYEHHAARQGIAVLGFVVNDVRAVQARYKTLHPNLIHSFREYGDVQVLEVFAYYNHEDKSKEADQQPDVGTLLRFIEAKQGSNSESEFCKLPGLALIDATFDSTSQPAYCDHWVSNVFSRTEFLKTLKDTLGFTPKVDFNAGVVAAGEAQIESTVTGNESAFRAEDKASILRDQSQVYLPINNALSEVGHVHGFLREIGQGIQHVASRVENLVDFIQRCNDMREVTGEGFTFLRIPRSYYGVLSANHLVESTGIPEPCAESIVALLEEQEVTAIDGAVSLDLSNAVIAEVLENGIAESYRYIYESKREEILGAVLNSRYKNLYSLLRENVSEETYLGIVRNQILCDVQGGDILYQIFTSNILQREAGEEAPFFEYIQRVCSECRDEDGCLVQIKPGCGGFGIRNFLTLFLSIEVSKAMLEVAEAKLHGDNHALILAQKKVDCFTHQLNDSNPILTQISDAMTMEGFCKEQMALGLSHGDAEAAASWKLKMEEASESKADGNLKLMECSARYQAMMRKLREEAATSTR